MSIVEDVVLEPGKVVLRLEAYQLERDSRGDIRGVCSIAINGVVLAYSIIHFHKDEERVRLVNSAYKQFGRAQSLIEAGDLKKLLDDFCRTAWDKQAAAGKATLVEGYDSYRQPAFILRPFILQDAGTFLYAAPGSGKSWIIMLIAVCIDAGLQAIWQVRESKVLFINLERSADSVKNRLGQVNRALGLPGPRPLRMMNERGKALKDVQASMMRTIEEDGIEVVLLDSVSRSGAGDLNENAVANKITDMLNACGVAWCAIGHSPRPTGEEPSSHMYGSIHFDAAADIMVQVLHQQLDLKLGLGLNITKENDLGPQPMSLLCLEFGQGGGLQVARRATRAEFPEVARYGKPPTRSEIIEDYLLRTGKATPQQIALGTPLNYEGIKETLHTDGRFIQLDREGAESVWAVKAEWRQA